VRSPCLRRVSNGVNSPGGTECAKVARVETPLGSVYEIGWHHRPRFGQERVSCARRWSRWLGCIPPEVIPSAVAEVHRRAAALHRGDGSPNNAFKVRHAWIAASVKVAGRPRFSLGPASQTVSGSNHPLTHARMRCRATDLQRTTLLQGGIVCAPVRRAVGWGCGFAHPTRLTPWSHAGNP
jgi:hypothetical protein